MLDVRRIKSKQLTLFARGSPSKVNPSWHAHVSRILSALNAAAHPAELDIPGQEFHQLTGNRKGTYAVKVSGNWRVTFRWDEDGPLAVDLEGYHGK